MRRAKWGGLRSHGTTKAAVDEAPPWKTLLEVPADDARTPDKHHASGGRCSSAFAASNFFICGSHRAGLRSPP